MGKTEKAEFAPLTPTLCDTEFLREKLKKGKKAMKAEFECWIPVYGTEDRIWISNRGHFRVMGLKRHCGKRTRIEFNSENRPIVADYKTGALGWYASCWGGRRFLARYDLMKRFPENLRDIDMSCDEEARKKMCETYHKIAAAHSSSTAQ